MIVNYGGVITNKSDWIINLVFVTIERLGSTLYT